MKNKYSMKPNILLILIDSLRSDKIYGSKHVQTPNIDYLMDKGIFFKNCFSSSDYTITGYGSIFASRYPVNASKRGMNYYKIFSKTPDLISTLKKDGYHVFSTMDSTLLDLEKGLGTTDFENNDQVYDRSKFNLFEGLDDKISNILSSIQDLSPWFYFIHINDLHIPVRVPKEFQHKKYSERYDLVVSNIDKWIGKILKQINLDNTVLILTADHGDYILSYDDSKTDSKTTRLKEKVRKKFSGKLYDSLSITKKKLQHEIRNAKTSDIFEKRYLTTRTAPERYLFDDILHVPLLFVGNQIPSRKIVSNLVRSIDISPTLANLLNIQLDSQIDGRSLVPIFKGIELEEEPVYLENTIFNTQVKTTKTHMGIRTSKYKYFQPVDSAENSHLYDLEQDPLEKNNIAQVEPEKVKELSSQLHKIRSKLLEKYEEYDLTENETKKIEEELKKLGYI